VSKRQDRTTTCTVTVTFSKGYFIICYILLHQQLFHENGDCRIPVETIDETGLTVNQKPRKIIVSRISLYVIYSVSLSQSLTYSDMYVR